MNYIYYRYGCNIFLHSCSYSYASPQAATAVPSFSENPNLLKQHTNTMSTNDRQARLHQELADTIDEVCGITVGPEDRDSAFVDLGLDSLLLTQLALQIKRHFNAPISFRQLMTDLPSPNAVVQHLDGILPADAAVATDDFDEVSRFLEEHANFSFNLGEFDAIWEEYQAH